MRLGSKNLYYIGQLLFILSSLARFLNIKQTTTTQNAKKLPTSEKRRLIKERTDEQVKGEDVTSGEDEEKVMTLNDFLFACNVDNLNFYKILKYIERSEIVRKLNGFATTIIEDEQSTKSASPKSSSSSSQRGLVKIHSTKNATKTKEASSNVDNDEEDEWKSSRPALGRIEAFLVALTNADKDGRIVVAKKV